MKRKSLILISLLLAAFVIHLDTTIVNVALPSLVRQVHASNTQLQWIVDAFNLLFAASVPVEPGQFVMVATAVGILVYAFVNFDFSVLYVAENSNSALPLMYRVAALWGAHEGSLLLWIFLLSVWTLAVAILTRNLPPRRKIVRYRNHSH